MKKLFLSMFFLCLIAGLLMAAAHVLPRTNDTETLGTAAVRWLTLYVQDVQADTLGIEDGAADGYFQRNGDKLQWVEVGSPNVTNDVVADVTS